MKFKLRIRLLLLLWGIFFLALFLPSAYYNKYLKDEALLETRVRTGSELALAAELISTTLEFSDAEQLHNWLGSASKKLNVRFSYIAEGGRVIADSDLPFGEVADLENHANRPEVSEAYTRNTGSSVRYSGTLKTDLLYVARKVDGRGNIPGGVLRAAVPLSDIFYRLKTAGLVQHLIILIGFFTFVVISFWLITHTSRSIGILSNAADSIGKGELKIPNLFHPGHEFYPLAKTLKDTAERVEVYIKTITKQKLQLESILEGIEEGILLVDSGGRIESANRAARNMLPPTPNLKGRRPLEVIWSNELQNACNRVLANEIRSYHSEVSIGPDRYYHVNIGRIEQTRQEYGAIIALHDISDLKKLEKIRRDFVANASHELRTPLTSIKGYAEVLMDEENDPEVRNSHLQIILKNTNHIIQMVNDLLQLAKVEDYSNAANIRPASAREALLESWKTCAPISGEKEITLQNDLPPSGPMVRADPEQLIQVFRNLLENAVKFSPPGGKIEVSSSTEGDNVIFAVSDYGPGIPKQDRQRIFERFYRVERSRGKEAGGTGLGLAICRHILLGHGGRIWVESPRKGRSDGSTFFFTLRKAEEDEHGADTKSA